MPRYAALPGARADPTQRGSISKPDAADQGHRSSSRLSCFTTTRRPGDRRPPTGARHPRPGSATTSFPDSTRFSLHQVKSDHPIHDENLHSSRRSTTDRRPTASTRSPRHPTPTVPLLAAEVARPPPPPTVSPLSRWLKACTSPASGASSSAVPPATSTACQGRVSSTCSTPTLATKKATFLRSAPGP